jgi:predicted component of type VI protein secretion system
MYSCYPPEPIARLVTPAQAGVQNYLKYGIPACAGMTLEEFFNWLRRQEMIDQRVLFTPRM